MILPSFIYSQSNCPFTQLSPFTHNFTWFSLHSFIVFFNQILLSFTQLSPFTYNIYLHTYIPTYIHSHPYTSLHTYIHTYIHLFIPTYLHTYIPTYLHTSIHTYIHLYLYPPTTCSRAWALSRQAARRELMLSAFLF
jgi:hypothetical protein